MRRLPLAIVLSIASISPAVSTAAAAPKTAPAHKTAPAPKTVSSSPRRVTHHRARVHSHKAKTHAPKVKAALTVAPVLAPARGPARLVYCADTDLVPGPANVDRVAASTLCLINQQRALAGLTELRRVAAIDTAATFHSVEMVVQNYIGQDGPGGSSPVWRLTQSGYVRPNTAVDIAENLAVSTGTARTPAATVATWMSVPGSRGAILSPAYTDTGIGVIAVVPAMAGSGPGATYTEDFGVTS